MVSYIVFIVTDAKKKKNPTYQVHMCSSISDLIGRDASRFIY